MPYRDLHIPVGVSEEDCLFVRRKVEPFLRDIHYMLKFPMAGAFGSDANFTFSSTLTLLEVIGGVSEELYVDPTQMQGLQKRKYNKGNRFKAVLEQHFPWSQEPRTNDAIIGADAAKILYNAYRCPLAHNLGNVGHDRFGDAFIIAKGPIDEHEIESIEESEMRPVEFTNPTLRRINTGKQEEVKLTVKCLYCGVRKLIYNVLADRASVNPLHPSAERRVLYPSIDVSATPVNVRFIPGVQVSTGSTD